MSRLPTHDQLARMGDHDRALVLDAYRRETEDCLEGLKAGDETWAGRTRAQALKLTRAKLKRIEAAENAFGITG